MEDVNKKIIQINAYNELMEYKEYIFSLYDILSCKQFGFTLLFNCICNSTTIYFKSESDLLKVIDDLKNNHISFE